MKTSSIPIHSADIGDNSFVICTVEISTGTFRLRRVPKEFIGAQGIQGPAGPQGPQGLAGSNGLSYQYSTTTTEADPGAGFIRLNNTPTMATEIFISATDQDGNVAGVLFLLDLSTSTTRSTIVMRKKSDPSSYVVWSVTGAGTDNGPWNKFPIVLLSSGGAFMDNDEVTFEYSLTGTAGRNAGLKYTYDTTTTATDPGAGKLQFNNTTLSLATSLFISETDGDTNALAAYLATWDDSTSTIRGTITMRKDSDPSVFAVFSISGSVTDNGAWDTFTVAHIVSNGAFADNDIVKITFIPKGDKGDIGATGPQGSTGTIDWPYYVERAIDFYNVGATERGANFLGTGSSFNAVVATDDHPEGQDMRTSTTLNNSAFQENSTTSSQFLKLNTRAVFMFNLVQNSGIRSWVGFAAGTGATMMGSGDTPAVAFVGFRFSTSVPDTNWQVVTYDGANLNVIDSGVAPSTTVMQTFRIEWERNGGEVRFYIGNTLVHTANTQLPAVGTDVRIMWGVKNLVGGAGTDRHCNNYSCHYREGIQLP